MLDIQNDKALIITEYIIEQRSYHDAYVETTWADCTLRNYTIREKNKDTGLKEKILIIIIALQSFSGTQNKYGGGRDPQVELV